MHLIPWFWNWRKRGRSRVTLLSIGFTDDLIWRTFDGGWRSNIKEFTASSAANTYIKTLLHYVADQVGQRFHGITDDLHQFREILQEVLSVKEQLNTVTVHLHPLNLLCTSFSCIGRMVKVDYEHQS
ncbi:hypothetical protein T07_12817 [Trichinella nelsoni]|uniref:Uncharacterized protein n=1 Tax=Trichinella nelsoni TaxID=6336 RepID=A0A0V0SLL0_9BILA|nr:hypothetical protein T07_12817 [Trichinella nelsoni]